jgi:hypothetical protein
MRQVRDNLQYHIHDKIPEEYQNCMTGMEINLKQNQEIAVYGSTSTSDIAVSYLAICGRSLLS